jgi:hypothetical protein
MAINIDHQKNTISSDSKSVQFNQTGSLVLPAGPTSARPSAPLVGAQRWNTTLNQLEMYNGSQWVSPTVISSGEVYITESESIAIAIALGA